MKLLRWRPVQPLLQFEGENRGWQRKVTCPLRTAWCCCTQTLQGQEVDPVILFVVDIDVEVFFKNLVGTLGLSIGFQVLHSTEVGSDTEEGTERGPKV